MAQIGCHVPGEECNLTPVDRIFTRIGANDRIMSGESTFMIELKETSSILNNATKNSLLVLDELGRGTSTYDGYSIAYSVIKYISEVIKCRCLFSTHYHVLTEELQYHPLIDVYHMKCHLDVEKFDFFYLILQKRSVDFSV
jgi:DNA mismatch repair protein MSH6